jgi:hypothetical protein
MLFDAPKFRVRAEMRASKSSALLFIIVALIKYKSSCLIHLTDSPEGELFWPADCTLFEVSQESPACRGMLLREGRKLRLHASDYRRSVVSYFGRFGVRRQRRRFGSLVTDSLTGTSTTRQQFS